MDLFAPLSLNNLQCRPTFWAQKLLLYDCNAITTIFDYHAHLFSTSYSVHVLTYSHFLEINEFQLMVFFNRLGKWAYGGS